MNSEEMHTVLKQLVDLAVLTANETAGLLNNGSPFTVSSTEPWSYDRAVALRGQAKDLQKSFELLSTSVG